MRSRTGKTQRRPRRLRRAVFERLGIHLARALRAVTIARHGVLVDQRIQLCQCAGIQRDLDRAEVLKQVVHRGRARNGDDVIALVQQFIMDTQHHAQPQLPDAQILVDVDLSILAASAERFAEYEQQVRAEYSWVPQFLYSYKRREILQTFLERESIFSTDYFRERLEAAARRNLTEALAR